MAVPAAAILYLLRPWADRIKSVEVRALVERINRQGRITCRRRFSLADGCLALAHIDGKIHDTDLIVAMVRPLAWGS